MTTVANPTPAAQPAIPSAKQQFLEAYEREHVTTMKVLRAFPADKADLRPHPKCKSARELAWVFVLERGLARIALTTGFDWSKPGTMPPPPETMDAIITALDEAHRGVASLVAGLTDEQLLGTIRFPTGPGTFGDWTKISFLWFTVFDQIHHRGQLSVYLRMADAKVPAIYGPSADEPFF
jgi:uncharacterized damage-inducible protein DinB